jgi:hypothetical protein
MAKVMECYYCKQRFPSTTYEMWKHVTEKCEEYKKIKEQKE